MQVRIARRLVVGAIASALIAACGGTGTTVPGAQPTGTGAISTAAATPTPESTFFAGKSMQMRIGHTPGGGGDRVSRLVAEQLAGHIPGKPTIVPQNNPGAGGLTSANLAFTTGPSDGSVIAQVDQALVLEQALGNPALQYDHRKVNFLGSISSLPGICVARSDSGFNTIQDAMAREMPVTASAVGSIPYNLAVGMNGATGTKFKVISGYGGTSEQLLAIQRGEADGVCIAFVPNILKWLQDGTAKPLVVIGEVPASEPAWAAVLKGVPRADTLVKDDKGRDLLATITLPTQIVYAYGVHPDVPADRVAMLRAAFDKMLDDQAFQAELKKQGFIFAPKKHTELKAVVDRMLSLPKATLDEFKRLRAGQ